MTQRKLGKALTPLQEAFLVALAGSARGDIRKAMDAAGYSSATKPHEVYNSLKEEIKALAEDMLASSSIKAISGIIDVIDQPGQIGAANRLNAAKELLDRVGIVKKEAQQVQVKTQNIFILPPKDGVDAKTIEGYANEVQDQEQSDPVQLETDLDDE